MKVILIEDVKSLGKKNEIKDVSDGYAKNFLFVKNLAIIASNENISKLNNKKEREKSLLLKQIEDIKEIKKNLEKELNYKISVKKNEKNGKLFGTLTKNKVRELFKDIEIKDVILPESGINMVGIYSVELDLGHKIKALIKINVI